MVLDVELRGTGLPLVVLPSFRFDHHAMTAAFEPTFAPSSVWARLYVDLPGTGRSRPVDDSSDAVLDAVVETIGATVGDEPFAVAGWSYGGYLAAGLARRLPGQVAGLMMICSAFRLGPGHRDLTGVLDSVPEPGWLDAVPSELRDHFAHGIGIQTARVAGRVADALARRAPTDEAYLDRLRAGGFFLTDEDAETRCDGPVSFVAGRRDRISGYRSLLDAIDDFSRADYVAIAEAGHYVPFEHPDLFAAALHAWLAECEAELTAGVS